MGPNLYNFDTEIHTCQIIWTVLVNKHMSDTIGDPNIGSACLVETWNAATECIEHMSDVSSVKMCIFYLPPERFPNFKGNPEQIVTVFV